MAKLTKKQKALQGKIDRNKAYAVAQARFFRAFAYRNLAELFGGVPIVTDISTAPKYDFKRATRVETYQFAITELEAIEKMLEGKLTVSVGIAVYPKNTTNCWDLIKLADEAMYEAKRTSKNKVELYFSVFKDFQKELDESEQSMVGNVKTMLALINSKDRYTYRHSEQVVYYAELISAEMGLPAEEVKNIKMAGFLHDIGKIEISQETLNKIEPLTSEEWALIRRHPSWGANIIRPFSSLNHLVPLILHHHERHDGKGYPFGLSGENISLGARIIAVADSLDAMTTERPYKRAKTFEEAVEELKRGAGTQFDPKVINAFLQVLDRKMNEILLHTA